MNLRHCLSEPKLIANNVSNIDDTPPTEQPPHEKPNQRTEKSLSVNVSLV